MKRMRKRHAGASSKYHTHFYVAGSQALTYAQPIIVYGKQDISQLHDKCNTFVEKLFDNSGHTFSTIFLKQRPV